MAQRYGDTLGTMIWRGRVPDWAWDELVVSHELIDYLHRRVEEIGMKQGRVKVRIGKRGRWVWVSRAEIEEAGARIKGRVTE